VADVGFRYRYTQPTYFHILVLTGGQFWAGFEGNTLVKWRRIVPKPAPTISQSYSLLPIPYSLSSQKYVSKNHRYQ